MPLVATLSFVIFLSAFVAALSHVQVYAGVHSVAQLFKKMKNHQLRSSSLIVVMSVVVAFFVIVVQPCVDKSIVQAISHAILQAISHIKVRT